MSFSISSYAEKVCIHNGKDYEAFMDKLPVLFREIPIKLGGESPGLIYDVFAVIKININSDAIVLAAESWQGPLGYYKDTVEVKNVCFDSDKNEMVISFLNNAKAFKGIYSDGALALPEITLKKVTPSQERVILEKINKKNGTTLDGKAGVSL